MVGTINQKTFQALFLEAADLPGNMKLVQDSRMRGPDPDDTLFRSCGGLYSGLTVWKGSADSPFGRLVDIRWAFPSEEAASTYHKGALIVNSEGDSPLPDSPLAGTDCHIFGGSGSLPLYEMITGAPTASRASSISSGPAPSS